MSEGPTIAGHPIPDSFDLSRILDLPQRNGDHIGERIAVRLSDRLRRKGGTMTLRPLQALGLVEAHDYGGILAFLPVGEGKTLLSYLLPVVMKAERPLLLVPGSMHNKLDSKTTAEFRELAQHWTCHPNYQIESYQMISRHPDRIDAINPDVIICDEVDKLKDSRSAVTKRVYRYLRRKAKEGKPVRFCGLSATPSNRSFREWWHIQQWALPPELQPLPYDFMTVQAWDDALAEKRRTLRPVGALAAFGGPKRKDVLIGFGKRLRLTPGIISSEQSKVDAHIEITIKRLDLPEVEEPLALMRETWETPDGVEFSEAVDLWRHARELGNGFYYRWKHQPPDEWRDARREFHAYIRETLSHSRSLDTMLQVVTAHPAAPEVSHWQDVKDSFKPITEPVWLTDSVLKYAADWARKTGGLVWVEHRAVGIRLNKEFSLTYFGQGGMSASGETIRTFKGPAAVSSLAVAYGFNLQDRYSENLILNAQPTGKQYEQLLGRTHRYGQRARVVRAEVLITVPEQEFGFQQARDDATYAEQCSGQRRKLCLARYVTQTK